MTLDESALEAVRERLFPMLTECVYLDTGSAGVSFAGQCEAAAAFYDAKRKGYLGREAWQEKASAVRRKLATMMGVGGNEIEFFSGTTDALNIVGHSMRWQPGDEIVIADDEFPSVRLAWQSAVAAGAVIKLVPISNESEREETLLEAVGARTRMLVVSHVHSMTGTRLDLDRLGGHCRAHNVLFVVDGIHALGATPMQMDYVDAYMSGVFKWLLAGFGLSVCVLRERIRKEMRPAFRGYLNQPPDDSMQFAHVNYPALYVLDASLDLLGVQIGWRAVHDRTEFLVEELAARLKTGSIGLAAPEGSRAGVASFKVSDPESARALLGARGIHLAARGPYLRASPFFYNSVQDVAALADAVLAERI